MVMDTIHTKFRPYEQFHCDNLEIDGLTQKQVGSALSLLCKKGMVVHGALKGYYSLPAGSVTVNPAQTIYDLLEYMAKAEPHLRRAAKILEAVEGTK